MESILIIWLLNLFLIVNSTTIREEIDFKLLPDSDSPQSKSNNDDNGINLDPRRPLYNIAHMCNSKKTTRYYLNRGANGIEVDVTFKDDDIELFHGYPCDCFRFCWDRERLSEYLRFVRSITTPGHKDYCRTFAILYFDLKLKTFNEEEKRVQGIRLAEFLAEYFFNEFPIPTTVRFIVAISYGNDFPFIIGFIDTLKKLRIYDAVEPFIGFDIGIDSDIERIRRIWNKLNVTNIWQGEGITNCLNPIIGHQLNELVKIRDGPKPYFSKVYRWTMDLTDSIRSVLQYHIDGIMTNHPERVVEILNKDPDFHSEYRLATIDDNPFIRHNSVIGGNPAAKSMIPIPYKSYNRIPLLIRDFSSAFASFFRELWHHVF